MSNIFAKFQVDSQNIYGVIVIYKSVFLTFLDESPTSPGPRYDICRVARIQRER